MNSAETIGVETTSTQWEYERTVAAWLLAEFNWQRDAWNLGGHDHYPYWQGAPCAGCDRANQRWDAIWEENRALKWLLAESRRSSPAQSGSSAIQG